MNRWTQSWPPVRTLNEHLPGLCFAPITSHICVHGIDCQNPVYDASHNHQSDLLKGARATLLGIQEFGYSP
ncbi:uncharacterized protein EURHEDRAFT_413754 [Aspergillus ruber CBS 135680]|uniref:Uncharacterized protein n=1 Tax=Aspergillus ruber (strain CBS 135680) TaxID=1388766 RepID=A0A017SC16_ASPRC|nr:uncharacterized protein EURHEDRAFT_413754 [Aspergillus ruber CBS 135680]EYE93765.1 hypothetical protein EURHEDRAFT_413754 [Aspergillus ruber CBS 135680]